MSYERIREYYLPYRDRGILPSGGGWGDQDDADTEALRMMDHLVAWWMVNEQKPDVTLTYNDIYGARRKRLQEQQ